MAITLILNVKISLAHCDQNVLFYNWGCFLMSGSKQHQHPNKINVTTLKI